VANDSTQSDTNFEAMQNELNALLDIRHQVYANGEALAESPVDPFEEVYNAIADSILASTRQFMGIRNLELIMREEMDDASQDSREL